ncbi:MAG: SHOCT domain-containing protein [Meiothermus sp.]|nr:SHOCT domain-containing protein [Meiothermus sp.]
MMGFGWLAMVLFWVLLVAAIVWLLRETHPGDWVRPDHDGALGLAEERYAKGEIDRETFVELKRTLRG